MNNTYIFQMKVKTKLKKASINWKSKNTSYKDMEKILHFDHMENTFFINVMTFSKSRHSLDLGITAASPFMKMHLHFCEWLSSFIWLDTTGKWHNEKGKWKFFSFPSWKTKRCINHIQTEALAVCIATQWPILIQIVNSTF